jgi:adenine-specific DNA-methyltransferase
MENLIDKKVTDKLRGGYYTPQTITEFVCKWAITKPTQRVLEPSCGDGNFIEAAIKRILELGVSKNKLFGLLQGVELIEDEAQKSKERAAKYGLNSTTIINSDFFSFISDTNHEASYDVVIGNPPFIRYQNFPEKHRDKAFEMMQKLGLSPNKLTNIWVPFLVLSASLLNRFGKLGMVIPAELFQVKYAAETRIFLSQFFTRITIITFKKLVFADIQQEVVLLLCEKSATSNKGIRVIELSSLEELRSLNLTELQKTPVKHLEHNSEKWTKYFLQEQEIQLLRRIKADKKIQCASDIMEVDVGLVTGRNEFFMINKETAAEWKIEPYIKKVVSRSNHLKGIAFTDQDFENNINGNLDGFLFLPPDKDFNKLPKECQEYIRYGEAQKYHTGYKCRIRKRWYITPSIWIPDSFVLRQVGDYPKIIINQANASSTDTIHRVRFKTEVNTQLVALSFLNSLSFAFSEILGRSYGGGVLTFEPTEIEEIPLPLLKKQKINFENIDSLIRERKIDQVLDIIDKELLIGQLKMPKSEVIMLRSIWKKLSKRRTDRN